MVTEVEVEDIREEEEVVVQVRATPSRRESALADPVADSPMTAEEAEVR
jgi:hypothetical protein